MSSLLQLLGFDTKQKDYAFDRNDSTGYTSAKKIPEKWVSTTCGYCSVGCGIEIGVKEGKAIATRALASPGLGRATFRRNDGRVRPPAATLPNLQKPNGYRHFALF